jgi:hypothetical protein
MKDKQMLADLIAIIRGNTNPQPVPEMDAIDRAFALAGGDEDIYLPLIAAVVREKACEADKKLAAVEPLLASIRAKRSPDVSDAQWKVATDSLKAFLLSGQADEALRLGWPHDELFAVPPLWSRVDLCGVALLIGDREVVSVAPDKIQVKTASGATLSFYRRSQPDYGLVYRERRKALAPNLGDDEAHFRAFDHAINFCRQHSGCHLEEAKALVRAAIAKAAVQ